MSARQSRWSIGRALTESRRLRGAISRAERRYAPSTLVAKRLLNALELANMAEAELRAALAMALRGRRASERAA